MVLRTLFLVSLLFGVTVKELNAVALPQLQVIRSDDVEWNITLVVKQARVETDAVSFNSRLYCYEDVCSYPGPTLSFKPGDNVQLTLVNELGASSEGAETMNTMHSPNTTNLHTHGLHIDPSIDTIFTSAGPGETLVYNYQVPSNHASGLHWYHSHKHGSSTMQIMGGLAGALVIEGAASENLPTSITAATTHVIVLTRIRFEGEQIDGEISQGCGNDWRCNVDTQPGCLTGAGGSPFNPFRLYSLFELALETGSTMDIDVEYKNSERDLFFVNGEFQPELTVEAGQPTILRYVHATGDEQVKIEAMGCAVKVVAYDGVYLDALLAVDKEIILMAATRVDALVTCSQTGSTPVRSGATTLFTLNVVTRSNALTPTVTDAELAAIMRPNYLDDLRDATATGFNELHFSQGSRDASICGFWLGMGSDCTPIWADGVEPSSTSTTCKFESFPGQLGTSDPSKYKFVTKQGAVNEWRIYGLGRSLHPLHLHVHHMQIISFDSDGASESSEWEDFFRVGQWRDTIPAFDGELVVRFRAADFTGETVLHCHFLRHEDLGMMSTVLVLPSDSDYEIPESMLNTAASTTSTLLLYVIPYILALMFV